jgi:hypothetical protein
MKYQHVPEDRGVKGVNLAWDVVKENRQILLATIKDCDPREELIVLLLNTFQSAQYRDVSMQTSNDPDFTVQ